MSAETQPKWWRNPWVLGTLGGLVFITVIRPCTRYVPPPPSEIVHLNSMKLPEDLEAAWSAQNMILFLPPLAAGSPMTPKANHPMARLAQGVALWEKPLALHAVQHEGDNASKDMTGNWTSWPLDKPTLSRIYGALPPLTEGQDKGLFLVVSAGGSVCAITASTKEGGIEAFHKSMRLLMDKNEGDG